MTDYYRHYAHGHVIRAEAGQHPSADLIAGTVVASDDPDIKVGTYSSGWMRDAFIKTTHIVIDPPVTYVRHVARPFVLRMDSGGWSNRTRLFTGTVVASNDSDIDVGETSTIWQRDQFVRLPATWQPDVAPQVVDTVESMQGELDTLRIVLGVAHEPADTLPARMVAAAQRHRKAYDRIKEWCHESR